MDRNDLDLALNLETVSNALDPEEVSLYDWAFAQQNFLDGK